MNDTGIERDMRDKIVRIIQALVPNARVYLYGSRARGKYHPTSDIDVAVDVGKKVDRVIIGEIKDIFEASHIPYRIDVVDLYGIPDAMRAEILKEGIVWSD